ncbi:MULTISPECIES: DUF4097 family beta strand repeat-containing protein [unclassified Paenibacillus]|uniref:DUF4097 family beta strand repeat-containing protein n=1 Tax=unclassified Paenibacillus TaxID=185978 RepID=UPI001C11CDD9|nr:MULTISPECIES: DUF4097 family beta strand repeat-containing protein [unclassified Paenibacillus]MBU5444887.1 DUF4097 domain-containing protein [Paenibacillus sp. MSJ-34]CAH0121759.1 hypothetical protein PAE9249_04292 [Paenibacillus sp. CECT 9249]
MRKSVFLGVVLVAAGLFGLLYSIFGSGYGFAGNFLSFGTKQIDIEKTVDADQLSDILVKADSTNVKVTHSDSDRISVRLHGRVNSRDAEKTDIKINAQGDSLEVGMVSPRGFHIGFNWKEIELSIGLPDKQWETLQVQVGSGNIDLSGVNAANMNVKTGSGNINASNMTASDSIALHSRSGNLVAEGFKADALVFDLGSGNAKLMDGEAKLSGKTSSGNIRVEFEELIYDADLKTGTGNVDVLLARQPESLAVQYKGGSGKGTIRWDGMNYEESDKEGRSIKGTFGSGDVQLNVRTGSGDFRLDRP